ncbi:MAG: hypothetical protein ACRC2T_19775 [Thermoguttaceae bacterium]
MASVGLRTRFIDVFYPKNRGPQIDDILLDQRHCAECLARFVFRKKVRQLRKRLSMRLLAGA